MKPSINIKKYSCPKCGYRECTIDQISTTGGLLTKLFNIQTKKFTAVTCKRCTFTEFYKANTSQLENVFDFITG